MTHTTDPTAAHGDPRGGDRHRPGLRSARAIDFEQAIDIQRPIEEVFAYLADFTNIPEWNYYVRQVRQLTAGPVAVGTRYEQVRRTDRQCYEVTVLRAPRTVAVTTVGGERPAFHRQFELEPNGRGTRLSDRWELDLGYPSAVQRLAAPRVTRAVGENLAVLKRLLERDRAA